MPQFRPRIRFKDISPTPPPPDPPLVETAGGWAGLYNSGAGVTGGEGGVTQIYTNWTTLWNDFRTNDSASLVKTYIYDGPDVTLPDSSQEATSRSNKTIQFTTGQLVERGELRFTSCSNIIIRNIKRKGPYVDRTGANLDYFTFNSCTGVWVDHVEGDGEFVYAITNNQYVDGQLDTNLSDFLTISNSIFSNTERGILIGYGDGVTEMEGMGVTIRNCIFRNNRERNPRVRFVNLGLHQNLWLWDPAWGEPVAGRPTTPYMIGLGNRAKVWSECNYYDNGHSLIRDFDTEATKLSGIVSVNDYVGSFVNGNTFLRPSNVTWDPSLVSGYQIPISLATPQEARDYALQWAGAKYHLKNPIV